jgi:hypothetical protein
VSFINNFLRPFGLELHRIASINHERHYHEGTKKRISLFYQDFYNKNNEINLNISGVVFSKNRAMQLHALLSSYFYYTKNPAPLIVLYTHTNEQHKHSYDVLQKEFQHLPVTFTVENDFTIQLKQIIHSMEADRIFFMTDDAIFLDHYDLQDCLKFDPVKHIFSLRLGGDYDFCFSYNKKQAVPDFSKHDGLQAFKSWIWADMKESPDWTYPLSVDATIFLRQEIELMLHNISFKSPNSLEGQMQLYNDLFIHRKGICYSKVKYVNVPCNLVQDEFDNNHTGTFHVNELLEKFLQDERIDWKQFQNLRAPEAQILKFSFVHKSL